MGVLTKEELLTKTRAFLFDLDGTVCIGETPIPGAAEALSRLRRAGKKVVFLTNNSSKTYAEYKRKLRRLTLFESGDGIYTSAMAAADLLKREYSGKKVFLLGTDALAKELQRTGVRLSEDSPELCLLAYDVTLTFEKLRHFDAFLRRGLPYLATHADPVCPTADGSMPDVGSLIALFQTSSGRLPDRIVGKPYASMGECVARFTGISPAETCMVGDRMYTDIRFANNSGMMSILVLSGETTRETAMRYGDRPDLILSSVAELDQGV